MQTEQVDWDKEVQGNMLSAFYYGFCVTQILGGWLSDRIGGSKIILLFSMTLMSVLSVASPAVALLHRRLFFTFRLLLGAASVTTFSPFHPVLSVFFFFNFITFFLNFWLFFWFNFDFFNFFLFVNPIESITFSGFLI